MQWIYRFNSTIYFGVWQVCQIVVCHPHFLTHLPFRFLCSGFFSFSFLFFFNWSLFLFVVLLMLVVGSMILSIEPRTLSKQLYGQATAPISFVIFKECSRDIINWWSNNSCRMHSLAYLLSNSTVDKNDRILLTTKIIARSLFIANAFKCIRLHLRPH